MHVSELIKELQALQEERGDRPVVILDGWGSKVDSVFWDADASNDMVIVVGD